MRPVYSDLGAIVLSYGRTSRTEQKRANVGRSKIRCKPKNEKQQSKVADEGVTIRNIW